MAESWDGRRLWRALCPNFSFEAGGRPILWHTMKTYAHYGFNDRNAGASVLSSLKNEARDDMSDQYCYYGYYGKYWWGRYRLVTGQVAQTEVGEQTIRRRKGL
jgi:NDP-sugar pyrophosphorylase family protein